MSMNAQMVVGYAIVWIVLMKALFALITLLVAAPISAALTFLLIPFWRWLETRSGIESVGHRGIQNSCE